MTVLRSPQQAKLAELYAVGGGLVARYRELVDTAADSLASVLADANAQRAPLLERIRAAEQARGDLPPAADQEINEVRVVTDRVLAGLLGQDALASRLLQSETAWRALLEDAGDNDWTDDERELIDRLAAHTESVIGQLEAIG
jgi:hypothetical protein